MNHILSYMPSIFTQIRNHQIPGYILDDNGKYFSILDAFPSRPGHTLVIPYQEIEYLFDMDGESYIEFWQYTKTIANILKEVTHCNKIGVKVEGFAVPHCHIHLIPLDKAEDFHDTVIMNHEEMYNIQQIFQSTMNNR